MKPGFFPGHRRGRDHHRDGGFRHHPRPSRGFTAWAAIVLQVSLARVFFGRYQGVKRASIVMARLLIVALVTSAGIVFPGIAPLAAGLAPPLPPDVVFSETLPGLGFAMSGSAGLFWHSYWLTARGYGSAYHTVHRRGGEEKVIEEEDLPDIAHLSRGEKDHMRGWLRLKTISTRRRRHRPPPARRAPHPGHRTPLLNGGGLPGPGSRNREALGRRRIEQVLH